MFMKTQIVRVKTIIQIDNDSNNQNKRYRSDGNQDMMSRI